MSKAPSNRPDFHAIQKKWSEKWNDLKVYKFDPSAPGDIYSIDSPPPFTSGALHMGHILSYAYFDFAARFKRMTGHNVFFPQGWDCQGFPTEVKVEKKLDGKKVPRTEFKKMCIDFTLENIDKMKSQMNSLGFSPDWDLEYRTIDPEYHKKVQLSILKMYESGLVYREAHPVLFCTTCQSAIAKAETEDVDRDTKLNYIKFKKQEGGEVVVATTRPEMLHACVALLVAPGDARFKDLVGKNVVVPIYDKAVKVMEDKDVDAAFGTGIVMVCTFGDKTDVAWTYRHELPVIQAFNSYGKLINSKFDGMTVAKAREATLEQLQSSGLLENQSALKQVVKVHDRCKKPVEYMTSMQWFMKLKGKSDEIKKASSEMRWIPAFSQQYLIDWADFIDYDWVISRQRIYGTPIPFYYCDSCGHVKPADVKKLPIDPAVEELNEKCTKCSTGKMVGESSVCDCWIDSSISPLAIAGWPDNKALLDRVYPASLRPQGLEIIRTWAFYTIYRCLALTGKAPFKEILINGNVLGTDGKKMSKSVGNFEDPELLLARFPADAMRQWAALSGAFARDRPFSYKDIEYSASFLNKLHNAAMFTKLALEKETKAAPVPTVTDRWIVSRMHEVVGQVTSAMLEYDYYTAINAIHAFFWHEFCDYYLELVKYRIYSEEKEMAGSRAAAQHALQEVLSTTLKLLAPFAPFTTEELYHELGFDKQDKAKSIHLVKWPTSSSAHIDTTAIELPKVLCAAIAASRKFKSENKLSLGETLSEAVIPVKEELLGNAGDIEADLANVARVKNVRFTIDKGENTSFTI